MARRDRITAERLRELIHYNPQTGEFLWKKSTWKKGKPGKKAGWPTQKRYWCIGIDGCQYRANILAWVYMTSEHPGDYVIDHINRDTLDNRWINLRKVTQRVNRQNNGANGYTKLWNGKFKVHIHTYIGTFDTPEEAHKASMEIKHQIRELIDAYQLHHRYTKSLK